MRISDWSDVCSSDLLGKVAQAQELPGKAIGLYGQALALEPNDLAALEAQGGAMVQRGAVKRAEANLERIRTLCKRSEEHTSELQSLMRKSYAVFCLKKKNIQYSRRPSTDTQEATHLRI